MGLIDILVCHELYPFVVAFQRISGSYAEVFLFSNSSSTEIDNVCLFVSFFCQSVFLSEKEKSRQPREPRALTFGAWEQFSVENKVKTLGRSFELRG